MVPLFYTFHEVAPTIVKMEYSRQFYQYTEKLWIILFPGFKALYKITEKYSGLIDKLKLIKRYSSFSQSFLDLFLN